VLQSRIPALPPEIASYIAGLIDGEGTITLTRLHAGENRRLVLSIANTELQILQFVLKHVRAGKITSKRVVSARHTPSFVYAITSAQALDLLRQVTPWLQSYKRQRAELALHSYATLTPRNGRYSLELLERRQHFEQEFLNLKSVRDSAGRYESGLVLRHATSSLLPKRLYTCAAQRSPSQPDSI
jgi:hypothetical protein